MTAVPAMSQALQGPDWSTIVGREVCCPLCDYNLRGLSEPRCPECGYRFDWEPLIHPPPAHAYLFEHHPEQNVRSFFRTWFAGLRPARFWREVQPIDVPRVGRLIVYWIAAMSLILLLPALWIIKVAFVDARYIGISLDYWWAVVDQSIRHSDLWMGGVILAWPFLTYATLRIFRESFARARLKPEHALRCALYSTDGAFWVALVVTMITGSSLYRILPWEFRFIFGKTGFGVTAAVVLATYTTYRLCCACTHYLRMNHALAMALSTQVIPFLLIAVIALYNAH